MVNNGLKEITDLNKDFYSKHSESFDKSRSYGFWEGFEEVLKFLPQNLKILDLGCGNGRFLKFLLEENYKFNEYLGTDNSVEFIRKNQEKYSSFKFENLDVILDLDKINEKFSLIVAFGISHHIPSRGYRQEWFENISNLVTKGGFVVISFWDFDRNKNDKNFKTQIYKIEENDYFLGWKEDYSSHRYCHYFNEQEIDEIIHNFQEFKLLSKFQKDQNTYLILQKNS
jgi:tRNA (uracil-5-)-methyltransferase TRM9